MPSHTRPWFQPAAPGSGNARNPTRNALGTPQGVFLCRRDDANAAKKLSSCVLRHGFDFHRVIYRLSGKCRLKSALRGFATFAAVRLPGGSLGRSGSRGATPPPAPGSPTLSDSPTPRLPDSPTLAPYDSPTSDFRPAAARARPQPARRWARRNDGTPRSPPRSPGPRRGGMFAACGKSTPKRRAYIWRETYEKKCIKVIDMYEKKRILYLYEKNRM